MSDLERSQPFRGDDENDEEGKELDTLDTTVDFNELIKDDEKEHGSSNGSKPPSQN